MDKNEFIEQLKAILELKSIELNEDTKLNDLKEFDSLSVMVIIAFLDEKLKVRLSAQQFSKITTVRSLLEMVGIDKFKQEKL